MRASSPARAHISTICASTAWRMRWCCARRMPTRRSGASMRQRARAVPGVLAVLTGEDARRRWVAADAADRGSQCADRRAVRLCTAAIAGDRQGPPRRRTGRADRRRDARAGARCRRARGGRLRDRCRRSPPPHGCARAGRAADLCRSAGQCLHGLALGRCDAPSMPRSPRRHMSCRCASTTIASSPIRWSRAARSAAMMRRGAATRCIVSSQNIHGNRDATARALGVPPADVRFVAPDVGGGFGAKNFTYAEHALILWAARRVGRPVKWIATRSEGFVSDHQARDHQADASLALDADGRFLALRVNSVANIGAYMAGGAGAVQTNQYVHLQGSIYAIPAIALHVVTVLSNTTPIGVTRGPGFAEAVNIIERLIDAAARQCGFDRAELRRRNMVPADGDADDQRARASRWTAAISPRTFDRALAGSRRHRFRRTTRRQRGARAAAWTWVRLPHQGHRRLAARERRYPFRTGRHGVADHRHADHRPGPRDDVPADPCRPPRYPERRRSGCARATPT